MSFAFTASGNAQEVTEQLRSIAAVKTTVLHNDRAGSMLCNLISAGIAECSSELEPHQVYTVRARGDSGTTRGFTLHVTVELGDRLDYEPPDS